MNTLTMKKVSHKKKLKVGTVQGHMETPTIPLINVRTMTNRINILLKLYCVGIRCQESRTTMNLKWPSLIMTNRKSYCCLLVISTQLSRRQERLGLAQIFNTFVCWYGEKRCIRLARCLLRYYLHLDYHIGQEHFMSMMGLSRSYEKNI